MHAPAGHITPCVPLKSHRSTLSVSGSVPKLLTSCFWDAGLTPSSHDRDTPRRTGGQTSAGNISLISAPYAFAAEMKVGGRTQITWLSDSCTACWGRRERFQAACCQPRRQLKLRQGNIVLLLRLRSHPCQTLEPRIDHAIAVSKCHGYEAGDQSRVSRAQHRWPAPCRPR
jgi:hypothetical protein